MIEKLLRYALAGTMAAAASGAQALGCDDFWSFIGRPCSKAAAAWDHGDNELILTGYAYHLRSTYTEEKLRELNEKAWGGGWARSVTDPDGDDHMLFLFGFHESHNKVEWNAGYAYYDVLGPAGWPARRGLAMRPSSSSGRILPAACRSRRYCLWPRWRTARRR